MGFDWIETDSQAVERFGYDLDALELHVVFKGGRHYAYGPVPETLIIDLLTAPSIGRFVNERIKPYFASREPEPFPPEPSPSGGGRAHRRPDGERQVGAGPEARR